MTDAETTKPTKAENTRKAWLAGLKTGDKVGILSDGNTYTGTVTTRGRWELLVDEATFARRDGVSKAGDYLCKATPSVVRAAHATMAAVAMKDGFMNAHKLTKTDLETIGAILARAHDAK